MTSSNADQDQDQGPLMRIAHCPWCEQYVEVEPLEGGGDDYILGCEHGSPIGEQEGSE